MDRIFLSLIKFNRRSNNKTQAFDCRVRNYFFSLSMKMLFLFLFVFAFCLFSHPLKAIAVTSFISSHECTGANILDMLPPPFPPISQQPVCSLFHWYGQAKFVNIVSILSPSQISLLPQLRQKGKLVSKVVKTDTKIIISLPKI